MPRRPIREERAILEMLGYEVCSEQMNGIVARRSAERGVALVHLLQGLRGSSPDPEHLALRLQLAAAAGEAQVRALEDAVADAGASAASADTASLCAARAVWERLSDEGMLDQGRGAASLTEGAL